MDNKGSIEHHFQRQRDLLRMEYEYEKSEFERLSGEQGVMRRVARGQCWFPVRLGRSYYNSLNCFVVEVQETRWQTMSTVRLSMGVRSDLL